MRASASLLVLVLGCAPDPGAACAVPEPVSPLCSGPRVWLALSSRSRVETYDGDRYVGGLPPALGAISFAFVPGCTGDCPIALCSWSQGDVTLEHAGVGHPTGTTGFELDVAEVRMRVEDDGDAVGLCNATPLTAERMSDGSWLLGTRLGPLDGLEYLVVAWAHETSAP